MILIFLSPHGGRCLYTLGFASVAIVLLQVFHIPAAFPRLCGGYMWNKSISKLFQPLSTSIWNNFISARGNLLEIISQAYCSSWICLHLSAVHFISACSESMCYYNWLCTVSAAPIIWLWIWVLAGGGESIFQYETVIPFWNVRANWSGST